MGRTPTSSIEHHFQTAKCYLPLLLWGHNVKDLRQRKLTSVTRKTQRLCWSMALLVLSVPVSLVWLE